MAQPAPYGSWKSPISANLVATSSVTFGQIVTDGAEIYWIEQRPAEGGRHVVVRRASGGAITDVTPPPFSARTRVHEYGGGAFTVADGVVYFANDEDQQLYRQRPGSPPERLTTQSGLRYADAVVDRRRSRIVCVREDHTEPGREAINTLAAVDLRSGQAGTVLVSGSDFYASPRLSPDGSRLAWLSWNHPNMPWDGTELWLGTFRGDGSIASSQQVAGGPSESIFQPEWSPGSELYFVSDRSGWWNLYRRKDRRIEPLCAMAAEFGSPQWVFAMSTYAFESPNQIICAHKVRGLWRLGRLRLGTGQLELIDLPYTHIASNVQVANEQAVFTAGSATQPPSVVLVNLRNKGVTVLKPSSALALDPAFISQPEAVEFPTEDGVTAHGFFYAPRNPGYIAAGKDRPPLLVLSHGGPTGATSTALDPEIQFWTSRGFAVLDVNYGGSTGYGRSYRERLRGRWGIVDVDDCVNGARYLATRGVVDLERTAIRGGSAGGYTTLCALTFRDAFRAGASYYGVSDLEGLAKETHKFESRYLDSLIGPYPARRDLYLARSPIHHSDRLSCPVIFLQGLEDVVVPPNQSERMFETLRAKRIPTAYLAFEGEQHGFRHAATIRRALEAELYFYSKVLGFQPADLIEPVPIENL